MRKQQKPSSISATSLDRFGDYHFTGANFICMKPAQRFTIAPLKIVVATRENVGHPCLGSTNGSTNLRLRKASRLNFLNQPSPIHEDSFSKTLPLSPMRLESQSPMRFCF